MPAEPLNILQTCFSHSWGGLEIQAMEVTKQLSDHGHNVCLACCKASRLALEAESSDLATLPLDVTGYVHPRIIWQLSRIIARHHIDIIHCQLSKDIATMVPALILSRRRIPLLLSKRVGSYINKKDLFHRLTYRRVDRVLAISEVIHRNVLDTTPVPPGRVLTLHDAIDTDLFSLPRVDRQKVRKEFGVSDNTILVGFVGRFSPGKGHEELLEAAHSIARQREDVQFLIVGEASHGEERYEQRIRTLSHSLGIDGVVTFAGFRNDIPEIMAAFDIFAFPSHAESFGVVLIEAMAMERPVVSTNCDGVLDIVVDGETGLYVNPRRPDELAEALTSLIEDPVLRNNMGAAGRRRVEELFSQAKQIKKIESLYAELLGNSIAPDGPPAEGKLD